MANVREYIQINPRVKTNKALGIVFPFNVEGVFPLSYTTKEQVKSNLLNVLLTICGMISKFILINFLKITLLMMFFLEKLKIMQKN